MVTKLYYSVRHFVLLTIFLLVGTAITAQERTVTGRIISGEDNEPLIGASLVIKGTTKGTLTDIDGNYSLSVPENATLVVSFVGYRTQEIAVGSESTINVTLVSSTLDEVVVTGYSVDKRRQSTGAVSIVKSRDLTTIPSASVDQQLQGRVAGLTVVTTSQPGSGSQVRIRGFGAFGGNEPLLIVDGFPVGNVNYLNPEDIESATVLKDASAASIYGARAANGVIVYTTKRGRKGAKKLNVSYDGIYGVTDPGVLFPYAATG